MRLVLAIALLSYASTQTSQSCDSSALFNSRATYSIGDTLSVDDQNIIFPVCNGSGDYSTGDSFTLGDMNGSTNGGDYKITIISMNATW